MKRLKTIHAMGMPAIMSCVIALFLTSCGTTPPPVDPGAKAPTTDISDRDKPNVISNIGKLPQMARPILLLFQAVKQKEPQMLAHVFSSRINKQIKRAGLSWTQIMQEKTTTWRKKFGDWHLRDIFFEGTTYTPPDEGEVQVSYRPPHLEKPLSIQVPVVKEGKQWYLDAK